jgi:hypothetical protein
MRSTQKSNRPRGRGSRKPNGSNVNRVYDSSGPEGKVRGTPQQIIDKYLSLARDAQTSGDRVMAENFLQHAEHYQRILIQATGAQAERREGQSGDPEDEPESAAEERQQPRRRQQAGEGEGAKAEPERASAEAKDAEAPQVDGLTTIDTESDGDESLLVATEEASGGEPQPAPRRRRSPRKSEAAKDEAPRAAETADAQGDGA